MMLSPVSAATQTQAAAQTVTTAASAAQPKAQPTSVPADTVQISAAAKAMQEVLETYAQTAKEAAGGDLQAVHLLARRAAEKANG